jgi:anti-anti-sigma factor
MCLVSRLGAGSMTQDRPRIETRPSRIDRFAAVVELYGEHDLATREAVRVALASRRGNLLVDLSECSFIGSAVIGTIVEAARRLARDGYRLELVLPPADSQVGKTLALVGIHELLHVQEGVAHAHAGEARAPDGFTGRVRARCEADA